MNIITILKVLLQMSAVFNVSILAQMKLKHTYLTNDKRLLHTGSKLTINIERPTQLMIKM